jgi:hypothetical protein
MLDARIADMMSADIGLEIRQLLRRVAERMRSRVIFDPEIRRIFGRMVETNCRIELQGLRFRIEIHEGDAISENIVDPPNLGGTRDDLQTTIEQPLIKAVGRNINW